MTDLILITIHGMGNTPKEYSDKFFSYFKKNNNNKTIEHVSLFYQDIIQDNQKRVWKESELKFARSSKSMRKWILDYLSDATTLEVNKDKIDSAYQQTHKKIYDTLVSLEQKIQGIGNIPVVLVAHSLGCQVISNYIYDAQKGKNFFANNNNSDFAKLESLRLLLTAGCNIPLFISGLEEKDITPIKKTNNSNFKWVNYYDEDDILAWLLKPLNKEYNDLVKADIQINVGNWFQSWNPSCHGEYLDDTNFQETVFDLLKYERLL